MNISRRWFIGGAASFGAFQGCRFVENPFGRSGVARLKLGVISDIHILAENTDRATAGNTRTFRRALRWFDAQGVDAVILAGDMADAGLISQLQCVADAWNAVFPNGRSVLDGRKVERCFIYGNHDWEGFGYNYKIYGVESKKLYRDHIRENGMRRTWEEVFEEEYLPIYRKDLKGYTLVGGHWDEANGSGWGKGPDIADFFAAQGRSIDPKLPFFYFQHPIPKDTCYGSWAWGQDAGVSTRVLSGYSNAIAFSGHSHYSLLDERSIWQGAFTSIGTGSLRYAGNPSNETSDWGGYENAHDWGTKREGSTPRLMDVVCADTCRSGQLVSVYDDHITLTRRDFISDLDLGPDHVMPLPVAEAKPFAFVEHAKRFPAPAFAEEATIKVERGKRKFKKDEVEQEVEVFNLTVPLAKQTFANRVFRYEVRVETKADAKVVLTRHVLAPDYHLPLEKAPASFLLPVPDGDLPATGEFRFAVTPLNCFGKAGAPLLTGYFSRA